MHTSEKVNDSKVVDFPPVSRFNSFRWDDISIGRHFLFISFCRFLNYEPCFDQHKIDSTPNYRSFTFLEFECFLILEFEHVVRMLNSDRSFVVNFQIA